MKIVLRLASLPGRQEGWAANIDYWLQIAVTKLFIKPSLAYLAWLAKYSSYVPAKSL